jgi:hypothetical protein
VSEPLAFCFDENFSNTRTAVRNDSTCSDTSPGISAGAAEADVGGRP